MNSIIAERGIVSLFHFTQADNLKNILRYGLMPRGDIEITGIASEFNDEYRYDDCLDAVCISISFPNYKMFYKLRCASPDKDWVVIRLDPQVLCDFNCAYCWTNAGDALSYNVPIEERMGKNAFLRLFEDKPGFPKRTQLNIADKFPTNPQAEVLVFDNIPIEYIKGIFFENNKAFNTYNNIIPECITTRVLPQVFSYRKDWEFWRV